MQLKWERNKRREAETAENRRVQLVKDNTPFGVHILQRNFLRLSSFSSPERETSRLAAATNAGSALKYSYALVLTSCCEPGRLALRL